MRKKAFRVGMRIWVVYKGGERYLREPQSNSCAPTPLPPPPKPYTPMIAPLQSSTPPPDAPLALRRSCPLIFQSYNLSKPKRSCAKAALGEHGPPVRPPVRPSVCPPACPSENCRQAHKQRLEIQTSGACQTRR